MQSCSGAVFGLVWTGITSDVSPYYSTLGIAYELDNLIPLFGSRKFGLDAIHGIGDIETLKIQITVYLLNLTYLVVGEIAPAQAN